MHTKMFKLLLIFISFTNIICNEISSEDIYIYDDNDDVNKPVINDDILYDIDEFFEINSNDFLVSEHKRWKDNNIPIYFDTKYTSSEKTIMLKGLEKIQNHTCFKFPLKTIEKDFLYIIKQNQCATYIGKKGGIQPFYMGGSCLTSGIMIHNIIHAIGYDHMHTAKNRDKYVNILWNNIDPRYINYFQKQYTNINIDNIFYDVNSIMHFAPFAYSLKGYPTIISKYYTTIQGQRENLTELDILRINTQFCNNDITTTTIRNENITTIETTTEEITTTTEEITTTTEEITTTTEEITTSTTEEITTTTEEITTTTEEIIGCITPDCEIYNNEYFPSTDPHKYYHCSNDNILRFLICPNNLVFLNTKVCGEYDKDYIFDCQIFNNN